MRQEFTCINYFQKLFVHFFGLLFARFKLDLTTSFYEFIGSASFIRNGENDDPTIMKSNDRLHFIFLLFNKMDTPLQSPLRPFEIIRIFEITKANLILFALASSMCVCECTVFFVRCSSANFQRLLCCCFLSTQFQM